VTMNTNPLVDAAQGPKARVPCPPIAQPFSLHDVALLEGPFKDGENIAAAYLLELEPDRLLSRFRKAAFTKPWARTIA